ncbi:hypothetical protein [Streptomyces tanashiensis]|uniref:PH domain-containing protein n=1 Tax=Streptomyces tanashiensis TaxID=67367 RepID=A0ABY6RA64_9ACTN|nr:hypothetical protein [Streptomyces tanashiensis]UZX26721.1 hypothetical protein LDH80_34265 [Streptomyces tanashiensis]GGY26618.1 hypothetical protein GCM10010299_36030 [Streptomyces tanashiensis]
MSQAGSTPGARPARRAGRWERYRVTHPFSARDQAGLWGAVVGAVGLAVLLGWALDMKGGVVIVAAVPFIISWYENRRTAFQFDAVGARFGTVLLPWGDVTQFVVAMPEGGTHALIGARLRPGAALPAGGAVPAHDPAMPAPIHVAVLRAKFDLRKMSEKARRYAPSHIQIVVADPSGERVAT